jgi:ribosomal protein S12 methylthiotransferase accessory factor
VRAEIVPRFYRGTSARDIPLGSAIAFPTGDSDLDDLHERIVSTGLVPRVVLLAEGTLPPVALASIVEPMSDPPMAHIGLGCSLSPAHAIERALTEAIQSRVVDVQGAREDFMRVDDPTPSVNPHSRRLRALPKDCWFVDMPARQIRLSELRDESTDDLACDVNLLLAKLPANGIGRAIAIDISPANQPLAVVRIVGPDFETTAVDGRIGPLAMEEFNPLKSLRIS